MCKTARSISISLLAMCLASLAWGDTEAPRALPSSGTPVIAYVPGAGDLLDAAVVRGMRAALDAYLRDGGVAVTLRVGRTATTWSNAAPEAVRLIHEEGACILVSAPDRRVAHLLAQIGTRIQVPVVSTSGARSVLGTGSTWVSGVVAGDDAACDASEAERRGAQALAAALRRLPQGGAQR